ncbi:hypothetical protein ACH4JS_14500 [Streptomyces sp. NPDC017638]|uniref:hypothetical protein n=1 Tax=Streptomyces sp. NPDC017638 TaxID=3365004 RepID=UPI0037A8AE70
MRQRHVFGTVCTVEAAIAGAVFPAVLGLLAWTLPRHRRAVAPESAGAAGRWERPRAEAVAFRSGSGSPPPCPCRCLHLFLAAPLPGLPA